ncbi:MAG: hypothetical protein M1381_04225 [Deltaproteobacteria bacterium]|nr:hypothetical protein [Deltaproteobacteria bacterium]
MNRETVNGSRPDNRDSINPKNAFENEEVYVMSEKAASNKGILRISDEETIPGNSI